MNIRPIFSTIALFLFAPTVFSAADDQKPVTTGVIRSADRRFAIAAEIVSTAELRRKGLMHRTGMGENQGMLFRYTDQAPRSVWMKNTLLALDVLFLSPDGRIISILENLQPCRHDPCRIFDSAAPAMYMLEVNANYIKHHDLKIGDRLLLP
ncbi:MAG: DUF192 domain-containing protein [Methylococcales bacterium]|nr:DUF192 domain-containing protein [Methylococcales bacterium]